MWRLTLFWYFWPVTLCRAFCRNPHRSWWKQSNLALDTALAVWRRNRCVTFSTKTSMWSKPSHFHGIRLTIWPIAKNHLSVKMWLVILTTLLHYTVCNTSVSCVCMNTLLFVCNKRAQTLEVPNSNPISFPYPIFSWEGWNCSSEEEDFA